MGSLVTPSGVGRQDLAENRTREQHLEDEKALARTSGDLEAAGTAEPAWQECAWGLETQPGGQCSWHGTREAMETAPVEDLSRKGAWSGGCKDPPSLSPGTVSSQEELVEAGPPRSLPPPPRPPTLQAEAGCQA